MLSSQPARENKNAGRVHTTRVFIFPRWPLDDTHHPRRRAGPARKFFPISSMLRQCSFLSSFSVRASCSCFAYVLSCCSRGFRGVSGGVSEGFPRGFRGFPRVSANCRHVDGVEKPTLSPLGNRRKSGGARYHYNSISRDGTTRAPHIRIRTRGSRTLPGGLGASANVFVHAVPKKRPPVPLRKMAFAWYLITDPTAQWGP